MLYQNEMMNLYRIGGTQKSQKMLIQLQKLSSNKATHSMMKMQNENKLAEMQL